MNDNNDDNKTITHIVNLVNTEKLHSKVNIKKHKQNKTENEANKRHDDAKKGYDNDNNTPQCPRDCSSRYSCCVHVHRVLHEQRGGRAVHRS